MVKQSSVSQLDVGEDEMCERVARRQAEDRRRFWEIVEDLRSRNADRDPDEIYRDVTEVVEEIREEHFEQEQCAKRGR